jgi:hypothetical protein
MFWGCFLGGTKGLRVFFEKDWGWIDGRVYRDHIVPVVDGWMKVISNDQGYHLRFMQDNATGHICYETVTDLEERGIQIMG